MTKHNTPGRPWRGLPSYCRRHSVYRKMKWNMIKAIITFYYVYFTVKVKAFKCSCWVGNEYWWLMIKIEDLLNRQLVSSGIDNPPTTTSNPTPPLDSGVGWWMSRPENVKILMNWDWLHLSYVRLGLKNMFIVCLIETFKHLDARWASGLERIHSPPSASDPFCVSTSCNHWCVRCLMTRRRNPTPYKWPLWRHQTFAQFEKQKQGVWRRITIPIINSIMNPRSNLDDQNWSSQDLKLRIHYAQFSRFRYNDFAGEWSEGSHWTMEGFRSGGAGDAGGGDGGWWWEVSSL